MRYARLDVTNWMAVCAAKVLLAEHTVVAIRRAARTLHQISDLGLSDMPLESKPTIPKITRTNETIVAVNLLTIRLQT